MSRYPPFGILSQSALSPAPLPQAGEGSFLVLLYFRRSTFYSPLPLMGEGLGEKVGLSDFQQMFAVMGKFSNGFADVV